MREHISIVSATSSPEKTTAVFEMKASPVYTNRMGIMHGGAIAMIHDMCTTMTAAPLARKDFWWFGGVSRTLLITYLRPVRKDMDLLIECEVLQQGTRLATIRGQMREKKTGALLSVAEHNKASINFQEAKPNL
jgi:acyl-coenzyme A thioesterase 13